MTTTIDPGSFRQIVFFTGAGMSAESGVPTYRGSGGIWHDYNWQAYACQDAFDKDPEKVLSFHEMRRRAILECAPHGGHRIISELQTRHDNISIVTQNIDGMHQRAGAANVIELHGSIWRMRCNVHGAREDLSETYERRSCEQCGAPLRPDITWFGDMLDPSVIEAATRAVENCDLFIGIGTSGVVWPAAGFPEVARKSGAELIEINPEATELSSLYNRSVRKPAGTALAELFGF